MAKRRNNRPNPYRVGPAPSGAGFEDTPENRQRIKDLGFGSILDDAPSAKPKKKGLLGKLFSGLKPRSRRGSRPNRFNKATAGRRPRNKEVKPDYSNRLPRPTKSMQSEVKPVVATTKVDPIMPTRPAPVEEPKGQRQAQIKPPRIGPEIDPGYGETLIVSDDGGVLFRPPLQDPFTSGQEGPRSFKSIPDAPSIEPDFDYEPVKDYGASSDFGQDPPKPPPIEFPTQQQQIEVLPGVTSGSSIFPMVTPENQPSTSPAPAGQPIPVDQPFFVDPFNLPKEKPSQVRAFGIKNPDGSYKSSEEVRDLLQSGLSIEDLKVMFGDAAITNVLTDR
tara:strand:+ start:468 stop:1466 length:999 start_codon:yes stop_codon:yes gene_type:complete